MSFFKTTVELFTKSVDISEISLKNIKDILKSFMYIENKPAVACNTLNSVLCERTSLTLQEIKELNVVDYITLLIFLKTKSASSTTKLTLNINDKPTTLNLNISKIIDILKSKTDISNLLQSTVVQGIEITYKLPTILQVLDSTDTNDKLIFVDRIDIGDNKRVYIEKLTLQERTFICNKLPLQIKKNIDSTVDRIYNHFSEINLLEHYNINNEISFPFSLEPKTIILLLSIIFNENLMTIYENMFMLSKYGNMSADYLEGITPGEYAIFVGFLEKIIANTNAQNSDTT